MVKNPSLIKFQGHIETMKRLSEPKRHGSKLLPEHLQVPSHYFQRWIWVQFPWLALVHATEPRNEDTTIEETGGDVLNTNKIIAAKKVGSGKECITKISTPPPPNRLGRPVHRTTDPSRPMNKKKSIKVTALLKDVKITAAGVQSKRKHEQQNNVFIPRRVGSDVYPELPTSNRVTSKEVTKSAGSRFDPEIMPQTIQNNNKFDVEGFLPLNNDHLKISRDFKKLLKKTASLVQNQSGGFTEGCIAKNIKPPAADYISVDPGGTMTQLTSIQPSTISFNPDTEVMNSNVGNSSAMLQPEELVVQKAQAKAKGLRNVLDSLLKERNKKSLLLKNLSISLHLRDDQDAHATS